MGFVAFLILCFIVCGLAWVFTWAITYFFAPPAIVPKIIWGVAVLIILIVLAQALGLFSHDVMIPRIR